MRINVLSLTYGYYVYTAQVAHALAVAEQALKFEHRDLHWGNVLVAKTRKRNGHFVRDGRSYKFSLCGVKVSYSTSKYEIRNDVRDLLLFTISNLVPTYCYVVRVDRYSLLVTR